jgi:hypothetical protein
MILPTNLLESLTAVPFLHHHSITTTVGDSCRRPRQPPPILPPSPLIPAAIIMLLIFHLAHPSSARQIVDQFLSASAAQSVPAHHPSLLPSVLYYRTLSELGLIGRFHIKISCQQITLTAKTSLISPPISLSFPIFHPPLIYPTSESIILQATVK